MSALRIVHCLLPFLYCTAVSATTGRIKDPDMEAINFAKAIKGKRLNGSVFQNISVDSEMFCQLACVKDTRCLSYNFGPMNDTEGKFNCQLSDSDRFTSHENFTDENQSLYRGIQSICESDNTPCGDKEICIPDYHGNTFKCKCATACSDGPSCWLRYGSQCYCIDDTPTAKQVDARTTCQKMGADLPVIRSAAEDKFIFNLMKNQSTVTHLGLWLGMNRSAVDLKFYWVDGTPLEGQYQNWADGEPKNLTSGEHCGNMYGTPGDWNVKPGKWNDLPCEYSYPKHEPVILCQKPISKTV